MNDHWKYVLAGIVVAVGGMFVSDIAGSLFNGMGGYGFGCILGICMYLCVVVVTCTGITVTKLNKNTHLNRERDKQTNEQSE